MDDRTMSDVVAALSTPDYPRIQESVFVKQYLPMFAADPARVDGIIYVNTWINVAGSPFQAVDVYQGNVFLYRVPPLLNSDDTMLKNIGRNGSIHETLQEAALKASVIPKLGEHHIRQWLTDRLGTGNINLDVARQWNLIFTRYNLPLIPVDGVDAPPVDGAVNEPVQFDSYEPL